MTNIAEEISSFIVEDLLLGKRVDVGSAISFLEAGIIDSTGVLELVHFLEERWGFSVQDEEMVPENLDSLDALVRFVLRKTCRAPAAPAAPGGALEEQLQT